VNGAFLASAAPRIAAAAARVFAASRFAADVAERLWTEAAAVPPLEQAYAPGELAARVDVALADAAKGGDCGALMRALRRLRTSEMARIAFRDLAGWTELDETLGDLSDLADACCAAALRFAEAQLQSRHGRPRDPAGRECRPVILGMGKLGGRELNFSSDIDLIFCYTAAGETDGERALHTDEYFARLAQEVSRLLNARTEDGFVFRVDTMLRPFGSAGAPACAFAAMEQYYQVHGREWERYALIKARPVAGDIEEGQALLKTLRPFVYRRYLDFNAIGSLRELKRLIEDDMRRKGMQDNVKLGPGGIRELEFIVQSFQLVRGGNEAALRDHRLRPVLRYLGAAGHLPAATARSLDECYVHLRRVENAIQMYADEQTHALPRNAEARAALCAALGHVDWAALREALDTVQALVQGEFERVFAESKKGHHEHPLARLVAALWSGSLDQPALEEALKSAGYGEHAAEIAADLLALKGARLVRAMRDETRRKLQRLLAQLMEEALHQPQPAPALRRVLSIVQAVAGRSTYLTLLRENDTARQQLLTLCAASPWLSAFIAQSPVLLDNLLDPHSLSVPPERTEMLDELRARAAELAQPDTEQAMELLRRFQKDMTLRIAAADLMHALPLVKVSDRLTWLAEAIVDQALDFAWREMRAQYGQPLRRDGRPAGLGVIAYGKFGGIELGYGSDLDLVFLHDCDAPDEDSVGGTRPLNNGSYLIRLAQRLISLLSTQTAAGRAYEVDMALRPSGASGLLVSSVAGFADYQRSEAWTWEHQALTRARFVAGSPAIGEAFAELRREVVEMRAKMRAHLEQRRSGCWDLKQGEGGLIDIEFITQYLLLLQAQAHPRIVRYSDNWRQLEDLCAIGVVSREEADQIVAAYRALRARHHALSLGPGGVLIDDALLRAERAVVRSQWHRWLEAAAAP
jgi:glutamate-ammonia-ligase adenylyltransferase